MVYDNATSLGVNNTSPQSFSDGRVRSIDGKGTDGFVFIGQGTNTQLRVGADDSIGGIINVIGAYPLATFVNGSERTRITSGGNLLVNSTTDNGNRLQVTGNGYFSGNVGIGTISPAAALDVNGNATLVANFNYASNGTYVRWQNNGTTFGDIGSGASLISGGSNNDFTIHARSTYNMVFAMNFTERMRLTSSGNLGLGVQPSAWGSGFTALQVKNASFWSTGNDASITSNAYYDGSNYRYIATSAASRTYHNTDGSIAWSNAPSGTAGNAITFTQAMTLTANT